MSLPERVELLVVGAGTAGAAVASLGARAGLRTLLVDRGPLERAGAQWINAVPRWCFDEARIAQPRGAELVGDEVPYHFRAGEGHVVVRDHGVLELDMSLLVARLHQDARDAGAMLEGEVRALGLEGGVEGGALRTDRGVVRADVIVDASGLAGARLLGEPPGLTRHDLCSAAQEIREVRDRGEAEALFARHRVPIGEVLSFVGSAGGYSVLNLRLERDHVSMLTGSIPAEGHLSGRAMIERFAAEHPWIGAPLRAGARAIPLGRPALPLAQGRVARIGDAALMVFSAHGSGIGAGLVAARVLVDAITRGGGLAEYETRWTRERGGVLAAYDLFRRYSQRMTPDELERLVAGGLLDAAMMRPAMTQLPPSLGTRALLAKAPRALRERALVSRLARVAARMEAIRALHPLYPSRPGAARAAWSRALSRMVARS
ncbi:NAD(P)/FAD-dependent oxidoreductase [Sandaracinus amylolyticus]|uniref:NAD(P)/FAD-dependent oxidoreductase n=1 Tax=Sandaracinus amylolyticus TaxID=927083 RepID=UPI001F3CEA13|nr:hypothetical protein [Sandaracinus amylolyticus]UJR81372.1 DAO domain-containing protein [Sandaracinus amylolyticus]